LNRLSVFIALIAFLVASGCSTKKNTVFTRSYHQVTARYNTYFNGRESFRKGLRTIDNQFQYDFTRPLPVFLYSDPDLASSIRSDMDRAIEKASKVITTKSITAKPDIKGSPSKRQEEFLTRKEYNHWVMESYLLMGKAHFYKQDYPSALRTFLFMLTDYGSHPINYQTKIWLSRTYIETGKWREAMIQIEALQNNPEFPQKLSGELNATLADFHLKQDQVPRAIPYLQKALEASRGKKTKTRYTYLLAQLYTHIGDASTSASFFSKVLKMNPPYEMVFNARISMALSDDRRAGNDEKKASELKKMLRDEKNSDFEDQIYYALGNIAFRSGQQADAMEYFEKSLRAGDPNSPQKVMTSLTLADIALRRPDYVKAAEHYEKAASIIKPDYPGYESILKQSQMLGNLAKNIREFRLQDSVQVLAQLSETERNRMIDQIIAEIREEENEKRMAEAAERRLQQERYMRTSPVSRMQQERGTSGGWYFYNQTTVNFGITEFEALWGTRKLEDNWRRSKRQTTGDMLAIDAEGTAPQEENAGGPAASPTSREYYLKDIPLTPEQLEKSHEKIRTSLFNMGIIFKTDVKNFDQANWSLEELNKRYPGHSREPETLYELHEVNQAMGNPARANQFKNQLISSYPATFYANLLSNPDYINELRQREELVERLYQESYQNYQGNNHAEVIRKTSAALEAYPDHSLAPKFMFLKAIATNRLGDAVAFRALLNEIQQKFPGTDISENSREILAMLDTERPEIARQVLIEEAVELYTLNTGETHYVICVVENRDTYINQLVFNIINFNIDHFNRLNLTAATEELSPEKLIIRISEFAELIQAFEYYSKALADEEFSRDVPQGVFELMIISESNYTIFSGDKSVEKYKEFFEQKILGE
jgi:tetratricopeptide (TPR) repeat protein